MRLPLSPTADDVQKLDSSELELLLAKLSAADLSEARLPLSWMSAGGHHNAPDGGVDVRIDGCGSTAFIPGLPAIIQSKAKVMEAKDIRDEMRPKNVPRSFFTDLAARGGSYLLVSGRDDCAEPQRNKNLAAMKDALSDLADAERIYLNFIDADHVARWVDHHEGIGLWLAEKVGKPRLGWRGFEPWANPAETADTTYIADDLPRVRLHAEMETRSVASALDSIRKQLARGGAAVRVLGQSGMGKTRLAQALFEPHLGSTPLPDSLPVYGDAAALAHSACIEMATFLLSHSKRAILIIDNCPLQLHNALAAQIRSPRSQIGLLTIDFDVRESKAPSTTLVRLEPATDGVIDKVLSTRAPNLPWQDRQRVVRFSGGNSRIALSLAENSGDESLAELSDDELVSRLFLDDRHGIDQEMHRVARALSLVYACEANPAGGPVEVELLAHLVSVSVDTFFEKLAELLERGVVQKRGIQWAVLPEALAAHLAERALKRLKPGKLLEVIGAGPTRLRLSFTRRLGLLHQSAEATAAARELAHDGVPFGSDPGLHLTKRWEALENIAPVIPARTLQLIVETVRSSDVSGGEFLHFVHARMENLLLALAYEAEYFETAWEVFGELTGRLPSKRQETVNRRRFIEMFGPSVRASRASAEPRLRVLQSLLASDKVAVRKLGFDALLEGMSMHPRAAFVPDFGAHRRTSGWAPQDEEEYAAWFDRVLAIAEHILATASDADDRRQSIAKRMADILHFDALRPRAIDVLRAIGGRGHRAKIWFSVCRLISSRRNRDRKVPHWLIAMHDEFEPTTNDEYLDAWVLNDPNEWHEPFVGRKFARSWDRYLERSRAFGAQIANGSMERRRLINRTLSSAHAMSFNFGEGIASAIDNLDHGWGEICVAFAEVNLADANPALLQGYVQGAEARDPGHAQRWLSLASVEPLMRPWIVDLFFSSGAMDDNAAKQMLAGLKDGTVPAIRFSRLRTGKAVHRIPNTWLSRLVVALVRTKDGIGTAAQLLHERYTADNASPLDNTLIRAGRTLLRALASSPSVQAGASLVKSIAKQCLGGELGRATAGFLAQKLRKPVQTIEGDASRRALVEAVFEHHPKQGLDALFGKHRGPTSHDPLLQPEDNEDATETQPLDLVPDSFLQSWVSENVVLRAPRVARFVSLFAASTSVDPWTPMARWLLSTSVVSDAVIEQIGRRVFTRGGWGAPNERSDQLRKLAAPMLAHEHPGVVAWAMKLSRDIEEEDRRMHDRAHLVPRFE